MKKFLIAILFLIPLVVVLAIQGAGEAISRWANEKINPTRIEIRDEFNELVDGNKLLIPRYYSGNSNEDGYIYIYISVFPKIAYSDEVVFANSQEEGYDGDCKLERVSGTKYKLTALKNGNVLMKISSAVSLNAYKTISIYVTSEKITDLTVYADRGDGEMTNVGENWSQLEISGNVKLYAFAQPLEAIGENLFKWTIEDKTIATIDKNGLVRPTGKEGRTRVTAEIGDKTGETHYFDFYIVAKFDPASIFLRQSTVYLYENHYMDQTEEEIKTWIWNYLIIYGSDEYDKDDITYGGESEGKQLYHIAGKTLSIIPVPQNAIIFTSDYIKDVYIENGGYHLEVGYADWTQAGLSKPTVRYIVEDTTILEVSDGQIIPKKEGRTTIIAEDVVTGQRTKPLKISVKKRVASFQLNLSAFDNAKGILQERKWGTQFFDNSSDITNKFNLGFDFRSVYPDADYFDLLWEISGSNNAAIDQNGEITFQPEARGEKITVSATVLVHNIKTNLKRSYTFDMCQEDAINVYNIDQFNRAYSDQYGKKAVCLQSGFELPYNGSNSLVMTNSLYGNGFIISITYTSDKASFKYHDITKMEEGSRNRDMTHFNLQNLIIEGESENLDQCVGNNIAIMDLTIPYTIKGVISRYAWTSVGLHSNGSIGIVESNILGQTNLCGLYIADYYKDAGADFGTIIIRNNVFRESSCSGILLSPRGIEEDVNDKNYVPYVRIEGFNDNYNWKDINKTGEIFTKVNPSIGGKFSESGSIITDLLGKMTIDTINANPMAKSLVFDDGTKKWVCLGLFSLGLMNYIDGTKFDIKSEDMVILPLHLSQGALTAAKIVFKDLHLSNPCYFVTYTFDANRGPTIMPGDACPENEELFNKLTGKK